MVRRSTALKAGLRAIAEEQQGIKASEDVMHSRASSSHLFNNPSRSHTFTSSLFPSSRHSERLRSQLLTSHFFSIPPPYTHEYMTPQKDFRRLGFHPQIRSGRVGSQHQIVISGTAHQRGVWQVQGFMNLSIVLRQAYVSGIPRWQEGR